MFDKRNQQVFYANISIIVFGIIIILFSDFVLLGFLFIIGAALLIYEQLKQNKGAFSISGLEKILTVRDTCGSQATLVQKQKTTACHVDNSVFCFKSIRPIGSVSNFTINDQAPAEQSRDEQNNYQVCMKLPKNPKAIEGLDTTLKCTYKNAFPDTEGKLTHKVDDETDQLRLVVKLPEGRPISSARAYYRYNGTEEPLLPPQITGETRIEIEIKEPILGAEYCLEWTWSEANIIKKIGCFLTQ